MKTKNCRTLSILVVICLMLSLVSCGGGRKYDEAEVKAAAEELIKKSESLNEVYYGHGIAYVIDANYADGSYYRADDMALRGLGISTLDDLKDLTRSVYTSELSDLIIRTKLSSVIDDESGLDSLARYIQKYDVLDGSAEYILVHRDAQVFLVDEVVYDYSTMTVIGSEDETVFVKLCATVTNPDGESQTREIEVGLIEESGGWRIDTPTYLRYQKEI